MEKKSLGSFIAFLRKEKHLTQKQLAELLNVSDKTVSHWECDETSPDISLLPELAELLGVSVDELLKGENNPLHTPASVPFYYEKSQGKINSLFSKIKGGFSGDITERFRYFRMLSLIGTLIAAVVLLSVTLSTFLSRSFMVASIPVGIIALFGSLWTIVISLGLTLISRILFSKEFIPEECESADEKEYAYKANRITYNNIFLVFCSFPAAIASIDLLPIGANVLLAIALIAAVRLFTTRILTKKGYLCKNDNQQLLIKYISICLVSTIVVTFSVLFFTEEIYHPSAKEIIFNNAEEFKVYMETPTEKPKNAYLIDGVYATTEPPTIMLTPGWNDETVSSPVQEIPEKQESYITETVYDSDGKAVLKFIWRNEAVHYYRYDDDEGYFTVITYEAEINKKNQEIFINDLTPIFLTLFCIADIVSCTVLYKKKSKALLR